MIEKLARLLLRLRRNRQWDKQQRIMDRVYEILGKRVLHAACDMMVELHEQGQ